VDRWHTDNSDTFDFSWGQGRLEVKSTVGAFRIHDFSLDQLQPPVGGFGYVASLVLKAANGGAGVLDLAKKVEVQLNGDLRLFGSIGPTVRHRVGSQATGAVSDGRRTQRAAPSRRSRVIREV
jgi:hypothetical protein